MKYRLVLERLLEIERALDVQDTPTVSNQQTIYCPAVRAEIKSSSDCRASIDCLCN
jgi:hypothetical protein